MKNKLSADPTALILGIVGLVIILPGCCCGLFDFVALTLCIIGLVAANKSLAEYEQYPDNFDSKSRGNVNTGRVLCIIGLIISGLLILVYAFYYAFFGTMLSDVIKQGYNNRNNSNYHYHVKDTTETNQDFGYHDTVPQDTLKVKPIK